MRDESGNLVSVLAPNEQDSQLFYNLSRLTSTQDENHALQLWAQVYTPSFKEWFGDWEKNTSEFQDSNGEPLLLYTDNLPSPESYTGGGIVLSSVFPVDSSNTHAVFLKPGNIESFENHQEYTKKLGTLPLEEYVKEKNLQGITVKVGETFYAFDPAQLFESLNNRQQLYYSENTDYDMGKVFGSRDYDNLASSEFVTQLVNNLAENTGIDFEFISEADANLITKDSRNPYQGQSAFYFNNKVYFVGSKLSMSTALHEYSHPLVRSIKNENPSLFDRLYNNLISTREGSQLLRETLDEYPEELHAEDIIKEEVIVKALTIAAENNLSGVPENFGNVIDKILFHIKQLLRKIFGKNISVSKLNSNTTIDELSKILTGSKIKLSEEQPSEEDVVAYVRDIKQLKQELEDIDNNELMAISNNMYSLVIRQLQQLQSNENYSALRKILSDESGRGDLAEMRSNLKKYETVDQVREATAEAINDAVEMRARSSALIRNIFTLDSMVKKIQSHMKDLKQESDQKGALHQMYYYSDLMRTWDIWLADMIKSMDTAGIDQDTEIYRTVNSIQKRISSSKGIMESVYAEATSEILTETWEPMNKFVRERHKKETEKWRSELAKPNLTASREESGRPEQDEEDSCWRARRCTLA
jgi:hypothetical protein